MRFYNRIEAVCRMNRLGAERRPFLFVIDYKQEQVIVEEPDQIEIMKDEIRTMKKIIKKN